MSGVTYTVDGRGSTGGPANKMILFSTTIRVDGEFPADPQKNDLEVYIEGPDNSIRNINVTGGGRKSVYHIGFTPKQPGQYWVDFVFRGIWADQPHKLDITDSNFQIPPYPYQGIYRPQAPSGTVPQSQSMDSRSEDKLQQEEMAAQQKIDDEKAQKEEEKKKEEEVEERKEAEKIEEEVEKKEEEVEERKEAEKIEEERSHLNHQEYQTDCFSCCSLL